MVPLLVIVLAMGHVPYSHLLNPSEVGPPHALSTKFESAREKVAADELLQSENYGQFQIANERKTKYDEAQEKEEKDKEKWKTNYLATKAKGWVELNRITNEDKRKIIHREPEDDKGRQQNNVSTPTPRIPGTVSSRTFPKYLPSSKIAGMQILLEFYTNFLRFYLPDETRTNPDCKRDLQALSYGLSHIEKYIENDWMWPFELVDSWGKTADGILNGNSIFMGFFKECINIEVNPQDEDVEQKGDFIGKYCSIIYMRSTSNVSEYQDYHTLKVPAISASFPYVPAMFYSTCLPSTCTEAELEESVAEALNQSQYRVSTVKCQTKDDKHHYTAGEIFGVIFFSSIGIILLSASVIDVWAEYFSDGTIRQGFIRYLLVFSVPFNVKKLFSLETTRNPQVISCLHGIRFLSICWVVLGHQYAYSASLVSNMAELPEIVNRVPFQLIANGDLSVDTFFFMSGLLVCYTVLNKTKQTKSFNAPVYYLRRFVRLLPPIAVACAFIATLSGFMVKGPLAWFYEDYILKGCRHSWWMDVTFIGNFVYPYLAEMNKTNEAASCMPHCWYTAVDMQLYLITPLIVLPLYFWEKKGLILLALWTLASCTIPAVITGVYDLWPSSMLIDDPAASLQYNLKAYLMPWCRAGPYVVGIAVGYVIHIARDSRSVTRLSKFQVIVGWLATTAVALSIVFGIERYNKRELPGTPPEMSLVESVLYGGFHRTVWGVVLGWIVLACHWGYGGPINWFLSHPLWQPLSRLTYCIYLTSLPIQLAILSCTVRPTYFSNLTKVEETCGVLFITIIASILLTLIAESPILRLEKLILEPNPKCTAGISSTSHLTEAIDERSDPEDSPRHIPSTKYPSSHHGLPA
ncbi:nose resistant to fluoxetine protein 6-like isoform X2 [Palaemon carinicauda]|uniref:nose resistant to fluoxetine protein 6-like isoform X2 n=1 Tax=Palaemon carinicauda TaxID=392227 RepID=UPI0035B6721F